MEIRIEKNLSPKAKPTDASALGFGKIFTDHMFMICLLYTSDAADE